MHRNLPSKDSLIKMSLHAKLSLFAYVISENEVLIDWNNYWTMLFMSKQVSLPKVRSILQKMKIGQNSIYTLFAWSPSIADHYKSLTWIKAWVSLMCGILDIFSKFSLFPKILASNCIFLCKMIFSDNLRDLSSDATDYALNWEK